MFVPAIAGCPYFKGFLKLKILKNAPQLSKSRKNDFKKNWLRMVATAYQKFLQIWKHVDKSILGQQDAQQ